MFKKEIQRIIGGAEYALKLFLHHKFVVSWKKILISYIAFGVTVFTALTKDFRFVIRILGKSLVVLEILRTFAT